MQLTIAPATGEATASDLVEHTGDLRAAASSPSSFGIDAAGELYVVNYSGTVYRLFSDTPAPPVPPAPVPPDDGSGRRRPPGTPPTGIAVPRGSTAARPADMTIRAASPVGHLLVGRSGRHVVVYRAIWGSLSLWQPDLDGDGRADLVWQLTTGPRVIAWIWIGRE